MNSKPCSWCAPKPHLGFIADNNGYFSDFDCDLSYGIGVCGGCGGLGIQVDGEDFESRRKRIMKLRFEYCPVDKLPEPPMCVRLRALKELKQELAEHNRLFGEGRVCYATFLLDTELDRLISSHDQIVALEVDIYSKITPDASIENAEALRQALLASMRGDLDEAEKLHRALTEQAPNAIVWHDLGTFLVMYRRNAEQALACYRTSCEHEPKKSLHFISTARLLMLLDRDKEALPFLREAIKCEDFEKQDVETKQQISQIVSV